MSSRGKPAHLYKISPVYSDISNDEDNDDDDDDDEKESFENENVDDNDSDEDYEPPSNRKRKTRILSSSSSSSSSSSDSKASTRSNSSLAQPSLPSTSAEPAAAASSMPNVLASQNSSSRIADAAFGVVDSNKGQQQQQQHETNIAERNKIEGDDDIGIRPGETRYYSTLSDTVDALLAAIAPDLKKRKPSFCICPSETEEMSKRTHSSISASFEAAGPSSSAKPRGPPPNTPTASPETVYIEADDDVQNVEIIASPVCHHTHWGDLRYYTSPFECRTEHWKNCILPLQYPQAKRAALEKLAQALAQVERRDVLSTVDLVRGFSARAKSRKMLASTMSGQLPEDSDEEAEYRTVSHYLDPKDPTRDLDLRKNDYWSNQLRQLYSVDCYQTEAEQRFKAVMRVTDYLYTSAPTERTLMLESFAFRNTLASLQNICEDPREDLVNRVAVYHVMLRTSFDDAVKGFEQKPLV